MVRSDLKEYRQKLGPIVRDTSSDSIAIVVYGDPVKRFGSVKIRKLDSETKKGVGLWITIEKTLKSQADFSARFVFNDLEPNTMYQYRAIAVDNLTQIDWEQSNLGICRTNNPDAQKYQFVFGSCRFFLQVGSKFTIGLRRSDRAFRSILELMKKQQNIRMALFIGDQQYTDLIKELPKIRHSSEKGLRALYRNARSSENIRKLMSLIETKTLSDDHDFAHDNYQPYSSYLDSEIIDRGINMLNIYDHCEGPFPKDSPLEYGIAFKRGPASFYLLDTRFTRNDANEHQAIPHIMSQENWDKLTAWLTQNPNEIKCLISPVPVFLQRYQDAWFGFEENLFWLVQLIVKLKLPNLFILSGDAHSSVSSSFDIFRNDEATGVRVVEICSTGLLAIVHDKASNFYNYCVATGREQESIDSGEITLEQSLINVKYELKSEEPLKDFRKRVVTQDSFASISLNLKKKELGVKNYSRKGKLLQTSKYELVL